MIVHHEILNGKKPSADAKLIGDIQQATPDDMMAELISSITEAVTHAIVANRTDALRAIVADNGPNLIAAAEHAVAECIADHGGIETIGGYYCNLCGWTSATEPTSVRTQRRSHDCDEIIEWKCGGCGVLDCIEEVRLCDACECYADDSHVCGMEAA